MQKVLITGGTGFLGSNLTKRIIDEVESITIATTDIRQKTTLKSLGVDHYGLDGMDRQILKTLIDKFNGGPVGVSSLAVAISEDTTTIEDVYEPYLIKEGFIQRTPRGRIAQEKAYKILGKAFNPTKQTGLF